MSFHRGPVRTGSILALLALCLGVATPRGAAHAERDADSTRATMREIFRSIQVLLPLSVSYDRFREPENRARIEAALQTLASRAAELEEHAEAGDDSFRHLGRSLERDAVETLRQYRLGHFQAAEFRLQQVTERCIACHSRLPSPGDSPLAEQFVSGTDLAQLPLDQRAALQIATRRFGDALRSYEALLASPSVHPAELLAPLTDYLVLSIRVRGEVDRPLATLERFSRRPDLRTYLRVDVERWIRSLRELRRVVEAPPDVAAARALLDEARELVAFPSDRQALVHYVVASRVLYRWVEAHPSGGPETAEAYYLLGIVESRIGRDYGVSQTGFYLETAIRRAPHAPFAEPAYAILEEETLLDYGALRDGDLPVDVADRLRELRALIQAPASDPS